MDCTILVGDMKHFTDLKMFYNIHYPYCQQAFTTFQGCKSTLVYGYQSLNQATTGHPYSSGRYLDGLCSAYRSHLSLHGLNNMVISIHIEDNHLYSHLGGKTGEIQLRCHTTQTYR